MVWTLTEISVWALLTVCASVLLSPMTEGGRLRRLPDKTLHIENVRREDAGTYVCQAQIRRRPIYQQLSVSVVVNGTSLFWINSLLIKRLLSS